MSDLTAPAVPTSALTRPAVPFSALPLADPVTVTVLVSTDTPGVVERFWPEVVPNPTTTELTLVDGVTPGAAMTKVAEPWMSGKCW